MQIEQYICVICKKAIPFKTIIDGKERYVERRKKHCFECLPFGHHWTRGENDLDENGLCSCKICGKKYKYNHRQNHRYTKCNYCVDRGRHINYKKKCIKYKGGKCVRCGYDRCLDAFDFHHRDPLEKEFAIAGNHCRAWKTIEKELDKCDLLCSTCHREVHNEFRDDSLTKRVAPATEERRPIK